MNERKARQVVIRTPDQRLRVFVSSTLRELAEERDAVRRAILKLHLSPVLFESGARPHPPQELYQAYLSQSHVFLGVYFQSYGWVAPRMRISGLEDEYNLSAGMPRLIYIKEPAPDREPGLVQLLERITQENSGSYKHFRTADELGEFVEDDLVLLLTEYFETARHEQQAGSIRPRPAATNIPIPRNPLIGRERELQATCAAILQPDVALVTLTGPGGAGKSRLAIQAALELIDRFEGGVHLVGLETIGDPALVIPAIAATLGVTETAGGPPLIEGLKGFLREKEVLLLLDNFEQVLGAGVSIAGLLEACPGLKILTTSRAPLRLRAERELPVPPLETPPPDAAVGLQPLSQYSAVRLFIQRAQAVKPDFEVTNENAPAVAEICYRLDGLPLAIELAAARIRLLSPQALLARLGRRFDVLRGGTRDLPNRQHTLYDAIDWSYNLLSEEARRLLRRTSVFVGGWTWEASEAVCDLERVGSNAILDGLETLRDNNLLKPLEDAGGESRLGTLETIREFAGERLADSGETELIRERHVEYFFSLAERAEKEGFKPPETWHPRLAAEHGNLRAALDWAIGSGRSETALRMVLMLWPYWGPRGRWREAQGWIERALETPDPIAHRIRAMALVRGGRLRSELGDSTLGIEMLEQAVAFWKDIGDPAGLGLAYHNLGIVVRDQGRYAEARHFLETALRLRSESGDRDVHSSLISLALVEAELGHSGKAMELLNESLARARSAGDEDRAAWVLFNLGELHSEEGDFDRGEACFREATPTLERLGGFSVEALIYGGQGYLALRQGDFERALRLLSRAVSALREVGNRKYALLNLERLALVAAGQRRHARAVRLLGASHSIRAQFIVPRAPVHQRRFDACLAQAQRELEPTAFDEAWNAGAAMGFDQAVAYALASSDPD